MKRFKEDLIDFLDLLCMGAVFGVYAFLIFVAGVVFLASIFLTLVLLCHLCEGQPIPWYEIVAPIITFFGIGLFLAFDN